MTKISHVHRCGRSRASGNGWQGCYSVARLQTSIVNELMLPREGKPAFPLNVSQSYSGVPQISLSHSRKQCNNTRAVQQLLSVGASTRVCIWDNTTCRGNALITRVMTAIVTQVHPRGERGQAQSDSLARTHLPASWKVWEFAAMPKTSFRRST